MGGGNNMRKKSPDGKVTFFPKSHKYKIGQKELKSVTTFLSEFMEKFDADKISSFKAFQSKRKGIKGQGKKYWKQLWIDNAEHGTRVHEMLEKYIKNIEHKTDTNTEQDINKAFQGKTFLRGYLKSVGEPIVQSELIVYNKENLLAGQIDLLVERNKDDSNDRVIDLIDYKTNSKIDQTAYNNKKCKQPIEELPDCSYIKYTLQLSMYAYFLEQLGAKIGDLKLVHLKDEEYVVYNIQYKRDTVERLLNYARTNRTSED
jgi:hypothetical protein